MLLLVGKNEIGHVIHAIRGRESQFTAQLHGPSALDITAILPHVSDGKPVFLQVVDCESEADMRAQLMAMMQVGIKYPFSAPTSVLLPATAAGEAEAESAPPVRTPAPRQVCTKCKDPKADTVPGIVPPICTQCITIELGLRASNTGPEDG